MGCEVVAKGIPIPYTYDKNGPIPYSSMER